MPFFRVVRVRGLGYDFNFARLAMDALQDMTEQYIVSIFELATKATHHAKRKTLFKEDLKLIKYILQIPDPDVRVVTDNFEEVRISSTRVQRVPR